jgi:hypothetical protein
LDPVVASKEFRRRVMAIPAGTGALMALPLFGALPLPLPLLVLLMVVARREGAAAASTAAAGAGGAAAAAATAQSVEKDPRRVISTEARPTIACSNEGRL